MDNSLIREVVVPWLWQLLKLSPEIIVYALAFLLALAFIRRAPAAGILALIGIGMCLLLVIASPLLFRYVIYARSSGPSANIQITFTVLTVINSLWRAMAMALLVAAAFVGRRRPMKQSANPFAS